MTEGLIDAHMHTCFSDDAQEPFDIMMKAAVDAGLRGVAVTDHCDLLNYTKPGYARDVDGSFAAAENAKKEYDGVLEVFSGIELGDAFQFEDTAKMLLGKHDYDVVVGSCHWSQTNEDIFHADFRTWSSEQIHDYLSWYYRDLLRLSSSPYCDVLAHLTYPLRYIVGKCEIPVSYTPYEHVIDEILRTLAGEGKALEMNTAGLRQQIRETAPPLWMAERFRQLGGQFVTLGSDAHNRAHLAAHFSEGVALLKKAGFTQYTYFVRRQPKQSALPQS